MAKVQHCELVADLPPMEIEVLWLINLLALLALVFHIVALIFKILSARDHSSTHWLLFKKSVAR